MKTDLTILLDMDGVLADFVGGICRLRGEEVRWPDHNRLPEFFGYGSSTEMWSYIDTEGDTFWRQLEILPWARQLVDVCQQHGRVMICTSPSANPACAAGKMQWLQNFFSDRFFREFVITPRKWVCAGPRTVLIDDHPRHCQEFQQAGGHAFLWPMPWNADERETGMTQEQVFYELGQMLRQLLGESE